MANAKMPDALALEALQALEEHGRPYLAAQALGLKQNTFMHRLNIAKKRGFHLSQGAQEIVSTANLSGVEAKGGWIHNYDSDGKKVGATRWSAPDVSADEDALERIRSAFEGMAPAPVIPAPTHKATDLVTVYPIADAHIGMMAWGRETGEDYNTKKAVDRLHRWMGDCIASSPPSETAIILDVGDLTHADDHTAQTPRSKHVLETDTRHFKTLDMTIAALNTCVEMTLRKHKQVIVRILPGNHDLNAYLAVMFALAERWQKNERVEVQKEPGEFFVQRFGKVLIAAHHGDKAKAERMVLFLADEYPDLWGQTRHRFLFTGHLHHHKSADIGGVQWEQLRAMTARDAYAASHAYSARAQLQAITYHKEKGEVGRVKVST